MDKEIKVSIPGREELSLKYQESGSQLQLIHLKAIGGPSLLGLVAEWRGKLKGPIASLPLPEGPSTGAMLLREVILRAQGKWQFPYEHEELCHCRVVATAKVDAAVLTGAHHPRDVSKQTSASTACGTCLPDVEAIIAYRLGK